MIFQSSGFWIEWSKEILNSTFSLVKVPNLDKANY